MYGPIGDYLILQISARKSTALLMQPSGKGKIIGDYRKTEKDYRNYRKEISGDWRQGGSSW